VSIEPSLPRSALPKMKQRGAIWCQNYGTKISKLVSKLQDKKVKVRNFVSKLQAVSIEASLPGGFAPALFLQ